MWTISKRILDSWGDLTVSGVKENCEEFVLPVIWLTLYFIMLKNGQRYFENLAVWTPHDF